MFTVVMCAIVCVLTIAFCVVLFTYKMMKCGIFVPFYLAEHGVDFDIQVDFNGKDPRNMRLVEKAMELQGKVHSTGVLDEHR